VRITRRYPGVLGGIGAFIVATVVSYGVIYALFWAFTYPGLTEVAGQTAAKDISLSLIATCFKFAIGGNFIMAIIAARRNSTIRQKEAAPTTF